jgi:polysaccharide chain length determinant protein (PEP-CTERM system associated)
MNNRFEGSASPLALLRALRRRKLILLIPILLLTPAIAVYTLQLPQRFRARALVGAAPAIPGHTAIVPRTEVAATLSAQDQLRAIRDTLFDPRVLRTVIQEFNLYDPPQSGTWAPEIEATKARIQIQVEGPEAFYVGFDGPQPEQVTLVANRLAGLFIEQMSDARGQRVKEEDNFLDNEVNHVRQQLSEQEGRLTAYKQSVAQELPERLAANLKQMETLQQEIHAKTDQITEGQARMASISEELKTLESQGVLEPEPPTKTTTEANLEQLRLKLNELRTKYTPEHPEIRRAEKQIQDLEAVKTPAAPVRHQTTPVQMRYVSLQAELKSIEPRLNNYRRERDALLSQLQSYERRVNSSPGFETAISERMRDASVTRTRYETLLAKQQEAKLAHKVEQSDSGLTYKIIEPAQVPTSPFSPHRQTIILIGFLASLGLGLLGVVLAERLNPSFETAEQMARFTNLPVLTSVPGISDRPARNKGKRSNGSNGLRLHHGDGRFTPDQEKQFQHHRLAVLTDPQSVVSQQYSILALKTQHWMYQSGGRILMVTSASGEEGKSVTALNLSLALASTLEGRVLLIDGDLRLPQVRERLGLSVEKGFGDLLSDRAADPYGFITRVGNLDVMTGGSRQNNPVGLLASQWTRDLLSKLRKEYELIIFDSPPIVPIADSHILAGLSDGVVFVVRARMTRPELFQRGIESLGPANVIGVVLNDVELAATPYAYAYRYYEKHYLGRS